MTPSRGVVAKLLVLLALASLALTGCAAKNGEPAATEGPAKFACAPAGHLVRSAVPEAKLTDFQCYFDKYKDQDSLYFEVKLKNVSDQPQRFRVNIFLDNGKAVGGLVPRTGKPPVLKPGQEAVEKYPVQGMNVKPGSVTLLIKSASY